MIRFFRNASLRQRFLVAPLLGLVVCGLLTAAFIFESRRQNESSNSASAANLSSFNQYSAVFTNLTEQHLTLYELLYSAAKADERTLYDRAKLHLYKVQEAIDELEQTLKRDDANVGLQPDFIAFRNEVHAKALKLTLAYRDGVTAAVRMATANIEQAPRQLTLANERFTAMNAGLLAFLEMERNSISLENAYRARQNEANGVTIASIGVSIAALLFVLSVLLARLLSRSIETQINALTELGAQADERVSQAGGDEVARMARAISAFRQTLRDLRASRDDLEHRVLERTQELRSANDALRSEAGLRTEAERHLQIYAEVIRSTGEAVVITDPDGIVVEINPAYHRATGRSREDTIGKKLHLPGRDPHTAEFYDELWRELKAEGYWAGELMERRNDGESFPCWALFNAVRDEHGKPIHYACVMRDITKLKQNEQQLEKLAFHDSLTGLPNRALFKDRLNVALAGAARQNSMLGVMYLDLDRFKYVNDNLGHAAGDKLLVEISQRIGRCLRTSDTLARMGGDEFTILLTQLGAEADAVQVADRIIETVGRAVQLGDELVYVGASVGISFFPKDGRDGETLQKFADLAMYEAKEAGRGQHHFFNLEMLAKGNQRLSLSVQIDSALTNSEFSLAYQPIVNLSSGRPDSVEALIRWQKPDGQWIAPATFIPHAEKAGLIKKIDCWVLERACADAQDWSPVDGRALAVCVNLSAVSLQQPDMAKIIKGVLQRTGLSPGRLILEITESSVKADPNAAQATLEEVTSLGVRFSVNDFGTGYSSLSYLAQFPINCLKLDRQFVERIGRDKASEEVVRTLLQLARKLNLRVVAEGVEKQSQQTFLSDAGCEIMQGYHFVRPMPGREIAEWLAAGHTSPNEHSATLPA